MKRPETCVELFDVHGVRTSCCNRVSASASGWRLLSTTCHGATGSPSRSSFNTRKSSAKTSPGLNWYSSEVSAPGKSWCAFVSEQTWRYDAQRFVPQSIAGQGVFTRLAATWWPYSCVRSEEHTSELQSRVDL